MSALDEKVKWDKWADVEAAVKKSKSKDAPPLVLVCVANSWNPPSVAVLREIEKVRKEGLKFLALYVCDSDEKDSKSVTIANTKITISTAPSLVLWYGERLFTIRRADWEDDTKFVGSISKQNLMELITYAKSTGAEGHDILYLDF